MAVTSATEEIRERTASLDENGNVTATRIICVFTDDATDGEDAIFDAAGTVGDLPDVLDDHPSIGFIQCRSLAPDRIESKFWKVTATYSSTSSDTSSQNNNSNPYNQDPTTLSTRVSWGHSYEEVPFLRAKQWRVATGGFTPFLTDIVAVANSCGDPFDPPPTVQIPIPECTVEREELNTPAQIINYVNHVNTDGYTLDGVSIAPGESKMISIEVGPYQFKNNIQFRNIRYKVQLRPLLVTPVKYEEQYAGAATVTHSSFDLTVADRGYNQLINGNKKPVILDDGADAGSQVFLNGLGEAMATPVDPANVVFRVYEWPYQTSFASLNLPA